MSALTLLYVILAASSLLMVGLQLAYESPRTDDYKIYPPREKRRLTKRQLATAVILNGVMTGGIAVGLSLGFGEFLFADVRFDPLQFGWQVLATLALYDVLYYCMHRFLFHEWKLLKDVHVVHHVNKFPTAYESLYAHPIEMGMGVTLLMGCVAIVGPISVPAFGVVFAVFSFLNLLIHSGLDFRHPLLRPIAYLNRKHARHHASMRAGNYASISPLPDILFGTAE